jgi:hypothetical protein
MAIFMFNVGVFDEALMNLNVKLRVNIPILIIHFYTAIWVLLIALKLFLMRDF